MDLASGKGAEAFPHGKEDDLVFCFEALKAEA
jgi:hypothetical protein